MIREPAATYRLQISPGFTLEQAAELTDYLAELGISHVYVSPLLRAAAGSQHGYDVVSHDEVDPAIGGEAGRQSLVAAARVHGLGLLVDIVPNHMGVADAAQNAHWWDVLRFGRASRFAHWFDVDWSTGTILLPVLADEASLDGELVLAPGTQGLELHYGELRYPVAPGTGAQGDDPKTVHERQHYRLVSWRDSDVRQNYRRFFAISELAGIRVELDDVFDQTHRLFLQWIADGEADGLRIDHPDGLADPLRYLQRLAAAAPSAWLVVEKILEPGEALPSQWPVDGTTGYDALGELAQLYVDPAGAPALDALNDHMAAELTWPQHVDAAKRAVAKTILRAEIVRMAKLAPQIANAAELLTELVVAFPVYRSYQPLGDEHLERAAAITLIRRPDLSSELDAVLRRLRDPTDELCVRFQQATGAVMAKGVEDTAYYRFSRFIALNEVGADPARLGGSLEQFHAAARQRQQRMPRGLTALSTHDTKRSEDVRARLHVLAELPDEWTRTVEQLAALVPMPDGAFAHLLWQTLVGIGGPRPGTRERLHAYVEKAMREEDIGTSWSNPTGAFEWPVHAAVDAAYDRPAVRELLEAFAARIEPFAQSNALSQKLVQLTMPGVPDVYQGSELWDDSLVDPDNRRPVDFARRRAALASLNATNVAPPIDESGAAKLWIVTQALRARRERPELFHTYTPLYGTGGESDRLIAFDRGGAITLAARFPAGLAAAGGWGDTSIELPAGPWIDVLTDRTWHGGSVGVSAVLDHYPAALLLRAQA